MYFIRWRFLSAKLLLFLGVFLAAPFSWSQFFNMLGFWQSAPDAPTSLAVIDPVQGFGFDPTPTLQVQGTQNGYTVKIYSDSACTTQVGSGLASASSVDITTNALATEGYYVFYARNVNSEALESPCSLAFAVYYYQQVVSEEKTVAADGQASDYFGQAVAMSGNNFVVGAPLDDDGATNAGSVYIHRWSPSLNNWFKNKIQASNRAANDEFGSSVAMSGLTVVVGAPKADAGGTDRGAVYVYRWDPSSNTFLETILTASDGANSHFFGTSVAIAGSAIIVGAPKATVGANALQGAVYVYNLNPSTNAWVETKVVAAAGAAGDEFGTSVAIMGTSFLVGSPKSGATDIGAAHLFRHNPVLNTYVETVLNPADGAAGDNFGTAVGLSASLMVIGSPNHENGATSNAGAAYIFRMNPSTFSFVQQKVYGSPSTANDNFGSAVSVGVYGFAVAAVNDDDNGAGAGSVHIFEWNPVTNLWNSRRVVPTDIAANDKFGFSVAYSSSNLLVGAQLEDGAAADSGSIYYYDTKKYPDIVKFSQSDFAVNDYFGRNLRLAGGRVLVSAYGDDTSATDTGSAYLVAYPPFDYNTKNETKLLASDRAASDWFAVGLSANGNDMVVGAFQDDDKGSNSGSLYIYRQDPTTHSWSETKLVASDGLADDHLGRFVAAYENSIFTGAHQDDNLGSNSGSAYVYRFNPASNAWVENRLNASDGLAGDIFGWGVGYHANRAIVGAYGRDDMGSASGAAYVLQWNSVDNSWHQTKLLASDGAATDYFSYSVAVSNDIVVVGAYLDDTSFVDAGSVYIYQLDPSSNTWAQTKIVPSDPRAGHYFGMDVAIFGTTVIVGAIADSDEGADAGAAYVYQLDPNTNTWRENKISSALISAGDTFGRTVDVQDNILAVGAWADSVNALRSGAAYAAPVDRRGVTTFSVTSAHITASSTVNIRLDAWGAPSQYCILQNNVNINSCTWLSTPLPTTYNLTGGDGTKVLSAWVKYPNGKISNRRDSPAITYDTTPPDVNVMTMTLLSPTSSPSTDDTPTIGISSTVAGEIAYLYTNSSCTTQVAINKARGTQVDLRSEPLTAGVKTFYFKLRDLAGNLSACSTINLSYEVLAPTVAAGYEGYGGYMRDVAVIGSNYFVAATGRGPISMSKSGSTFLPENYLKMPGIRAIESYSTNRLAVADTTLGLVLLTVSGGTTMTSVGSLNVGAATDVVVNATNDRAYVSLGTAGIVVVDISNPAAPVSLGTFDTVGTAAGLSIVGTTLYVADGASGLVVLNVTTPASITQLGSFDTTGTTTDVKVVGSRAYVADGANGFTIFDITTPAAITQVGTYNTAGNANALSLNGTMAFVADGSAGLQLIDFSTESAPALLGTYNTNGSAEKSLWAGSNIVLVADGGNGLLEVNASTPSAPALGSWADTVASADEIAFKDNIVYIADGTNGVLAINMATKAVVWSLPMTDARAVEVEGNYLYVGDRFTFYIYDITNPSSPSQVASTTSIRYIEEIDIQGNYAFVASSEWGFLVMDITNKTAPTFIAFNDPGDGSRGLVCENQICFMVHNTFGLLIYDISNVLVAKELSRLAIGSSVGIKKNGNYLFIGNGTGHKIVDVSSLTAPVEVAALPLSGSSTDLYYKNNIVYQGAGASGVHKVNVTTKSAPSDLGATVSYNSTRDVIVLGSKMLLTDGAAGFTLLNAP